MLVKLDPSAVQVRNGKLLVPILLMPSPGDRTYARHYVEVPLLPLEGYTGPANADGTPVSDDAYRAWLSSLPKIWKLNSCAKIFVLVPETFTKDEFLTWLASLLTPNAVATLDSCLAQSNAAHLLTTFLKTRTIFTDKLVKTSDYIGLAEAVKTKLANISLPLSYGTAETIIPRSINVGYLSAGQATSTYAKGRTLISKDNAANLNGTLTTFQVWIKTADATDSWFGTQYIDGTNYTSRDSFHGGAVTNGSLQTIDVSAAPVDVVTGDFASAWFNSGVTACELDDAFGTTTQGLTYTGNGLDAPPETITYALISNRQQLAIYATGTEAAGWTKNFNGVANASIGKINGVAIASIGKVDGI